MQTNPAEGNNQNPNPKTDSNNLASFAGLPYSQQKTDSEGGNSSPEIQELDITAAEEQSQQEARWDIAAERIWKSGNAIDYIVNSIHRFHVGDNTAITAMLLSYAATRILNGDGIHISLSGSAGTGKSHSATTTADHLPQSGYIDARISNKALFYHDIQPRTVLIFDDQELNEEIQEVIKIASSNWTHSAKYLTVSNQKPVERTLPPMCPFWVIKANLTGDEQVLDRQLVLWTDESDEQRAAVQMAIFRKALNPDAAEDRGTVEISRRIWKHVPVNAIVKIPYADAIQCDIMMDPRNIKLFIGIIQAIALMHGPDRQTKPEVINPNPNPDGASDTQQRADAAEITATFQDFAEACRLINPLLQNKGGSQRLKLSRTASNLLDSLVAAGESREYSFGELRHLTKMSAALISQALYGRQDTATNGLLALCPALEVVTNTIKTDNGNGTITQKSVIWNNNLYGIWRGGRSIFYLRDDVLRDAIGEMRTEEEREKLDKINQELLSREHATDADTAPAE